MELEHAIATEVRRLDAVAAAASREIADRRPFWVRALAFLQAVMF